MADEHSKGYLFEHQTTAKESYLAGLMRCQSILEQMETAFEACNIERKKYRDELDIINQRFSGNRDKWAERIWQKDQLKE